MYPPEGAPRRSRASGWRQRRLGAPAAWAPRGETGPGQPEVCRLAPLGPQALGVPILPGPASHPGTPDGAWGGGTGVYPVNYHLQSWFVPPNKLRTENVHILRFHLLPFPFDIFVAGLHPESHVTKSPCLLRLLWAVTVSQTFLVFDDLDRIQLGLGRKTTEGKCPSSHHVRAPAGTVTGHWDANLDHLAEIGPAVALGALPAFPASLCHTLMGVDVSSLALS
ncbi:PREDICTED: uncharacterized protein LOC109387619 [Hipposideros armiger]|uniref:Uncharacterized protein LOC109387619 n=1 Tax=Hipposideros armiger TaxID=186990 RepID=A0A8B7S1M6_HIPAR|nr:PREDICTED: uncharacterized protein LOC109387619 [Hipposideros armiger]